MSRYFSSRYLQAREGLGRREIDHDLHCAACGYNVRGLNYGRACPECGVTITPRATQDVLLETTPEQRSRYRAGFLIAAICLFTAALMRLTLYFTAMPGMFFVSIDTYLIAGAVHAVLFTVAVWLITPRHLDARYHSWRIMRRIIRFSQLLWIPAYACWIAQYQALPGSTLVGLLLLMQVLLRLGAGVGVILLAILYKRIVVDIELDDLEPRLRNFIWFTPIVTLVLIPLGFVAPPWIIWALFIVLLGPWCYLVASLGTVMWRLFQHVRWGMREGYQSFGRSDRIAARRAEMDAEVESRVRPMP